MVILVYLWHIGADVNWVQLADDRTPLKKEDASDQLLGVLHLDDGPFLDCLIQLFVLPVIAHLGMDHVLVDGSQFLG